MESEKSKAVIAVVRASRPLFRSRHDRVAFAVHSAFLASGYSLAATGPAAYAADALSSSSTEEVGIERWNDANDEYAFVYVSPEDSKKVLVKCLAIEDKLVVDALKDGAAEPVHLEIDIDEFTGEDGAANYSGQFKNLHKLVKSLDTEILSKLNGSWRPSSSTNAVRVVRPPVFPFYFDGRFHGPWVAIYPTRGGYGSSGSMIIELDDPSWFGGEAGHPCFPGAQPGVPPGAIFDPYPYPYGLPGVPDFEPSQFVRNPRRHGGGTHPDFEHLRDVTDFIRIEQVVTSPPCLLDQRRI